MQDKYRFRLQNTRKSIIYMLEMTKFTAFWLAQTMDGKTRFLIF
jgi:hypothetical protein